MNKQKLKKEQTHGLQDYIVKNKQYFLCKILGTHPFRSSKNPLHKKRVVLGRNLRTKQKKLY